MQKLIQLDGSAGGGQVLRTALSLSLVTGQPFRMTGIRGQRRKPGLMRQHLTCVRAAAEISGGVADGAEIGSCDLVFRPGVVRPGEYRFAIGTAGSTTLLFQTLFPALSLAGGTSTLRLEGGTHNPLAPTFDFLERAFLPAVEMLGFDAEVSLLEAGFAPVGGGVMEARVRPADLRPATWLERGEPLGQSLRVLSQGVPAQVAGRIARSACAALGWDPETAATDARTGQSAGIACLAESRFAAATELCSALGERGVTAEKVGHRCARAMQNYLGSGAVVGRWLADQLLLPMALAGGGEFLTMHPDDHVPTNICIIEAMLPLRFATLHEPDRRFRIEAGTPSTAPGGR